MVSALMLRIFFLSTLLHLSDAGGAVIFCPMLEIAPRVRGREDTALDMYSAWTTQGYYGQLFHTGCDPTYPSQEEITCQDSVKEFQALTISFTFA